MIMTAPMTTLIAGGGDYFIGTVAVTGKSFSAIVIQSDAVVSAITDIDGNDLMTEKNYSGNTLPKGYVIGKSRNGKPIANITLSSGSAEGIW